MRLWTTSRPKWPRWPIRLRHLHSSHAAQTVVADATQSHVFLIPDEGAVEITALHSRLYSGVLKPHLRTDIPFVPHMTIGAAPDSTAALSLAAQVDANARVVRGTVDALELIDITAARIQSVATHTLN